MAHEKHRDASKKSRFMDTVNYGKFSDLNMESMNHADVAVACYLVVTKCRDLVKGAADLLSAMGVQSVSHR